MKAAAQSYLDVIFSTRTPEEYVRVRETTPTFSYDPTYLLGKGEDGYYYAVFLCAEDLYEYDLLYPDVFCGCDVASFNSKLISSKENAFKIGKYLQ